MKPKVSRRKAVTEIRAEISEIEIRKIIIKVNKTQGWLFEKINKIDRLLIFTLIKKRSKDSNKIIDEGRGITTDATEIQRIMSQL